MNDALGGAGRRHSLRSARLRLARPRCLHRIPRMTPRHFTIACFAFTLAMASGACKKSENDSNRPNEHSHNLCKAYDSCDACIAGQQARGNSKGSAETECGLAVTGCWTTWEKPVVCGEKTYHERP